MRDKFSVFGEMISEELICLSPKQQIYKEKLMHDALHISILKKFKDDEKPLNENVDRVVKIDEEYVKHDKTPEKILTDYNENIVVVISMILPKGLRSGAFDLMKVLLRKKHVTFNENYTITRLKTGMNIAIQEFLQGIFVMKSKVKEYEVFFKMIMNHIPTDLIRNPKLTNLKENQDITKSIGGGSKRKKGFKWLLFT